MNDQDSEFEKGVGMNKAELRAKAEETLKETDRWLSNQDRTDIIEAALTQVHNEGKREGYNEVIKAAAVSCAAIGRSISADVRRWGSLSRVTSTHVGEFFTRATKAIRSLRIEDKG